MGGTAGNAHLAAGAYVQKPFQGTGSGRKNALGGVQSLGGVPAASRQGGAGKPGSGSPQEFTAGTFHDNGRRRYRRRTGRSLFPFLFGRNQSPGPGEPAVADSSLITGAHAIVARHATGGVYPVFLEIQALGLAGFDALAALSAGCGIKTQPEKRNAGKEPQQSAHGTHRVAIQTPLPGAPDDHSPSIPAEAARREARPG